MAVPDKNNLHFLLMLCRDNYTGKYFSFAGFLFQSTVQSAECDPVVFVTIEHLWHIFSHTYYWQMFVELSKDRWPAKPAVHADIVSLDAKRQGTFNHSLKLFCRFGMASSRLL